MRLSNPAPLLFVSLAVWLSACGPSAVPDTREADSKAIRDIETQWNADFASKDVDKLNAHYATDGVLMTPGALPASTPETRKILLRELVNDPAGSIKLQTASVDVARSGDLAASRGTYDLTMTDLATKKVMNDHGSYVTVYRKQPDGAWKVVSDINVSAVPPPSPAKKTAVKKTAVRKAAPKKRR